MPTGYLPVDPDGERGRFKRALDTSNFNCNLQRLTFGLYFVATV